VGKDGVIRLSAPRRAALQRLVLPVLVLLSVTMIVVGKLDQVVFEPLRISFTDAAAPTLDALSRPIAAAGNLIDRARGVINLYQENGRLEAGPLARQMAAGGKHGESWQHCDPLVLDMS